MNPNILHQASPQGALTVARFAHLELFEYCLRTYLFRHLASSDLTREEKLANLPIVEEELATMLGALHVANVPDYKTRTETVARELNFRIRQGKLDEDLKASGQKTNGGGSTESRPTQLPAANH